MERARPWASVGTTRLHGVHLIQPATSQTVRPSIVVNDIPVIGDPSSTTEEAGTSSRTHCPVAGRSPTRYLLGCPSTPHTVESTPQYARCSQSELPTCHCNMISLGGDIGSSHT